MARRFGLHAVLAGLTLLMLALNASAVLAQDEMPPAAGAALGIGMMVFIGLCVLIGLAIQIWIIVFLYKDAEARSGSGVLWAVLGLLFGWIALIVWLIIRPKT